MDVTLGMLLAVLVPLATALCLAFPGTERAYARQVSLGALAFALAVGWTVVTWLFAGAKPIELVLGDLYRRADYAFSVVFYFDRDSAVYLSLTAFLGAIIVKYCRYYLHREPGYRRFFATIFAFLFGTSIVAMGGTLDVVFIGWEVVGVASFLLIGFYRERVAPVRNAFRAYTVYRLCDVGLLLGVWLEHLVWHDTQRFSVLATLDAHTLAALGPASLFGLSGLVLLAAAGKSAQFPFCFWLPRAMEGPTPSSAIFYGALSVHAGVFLLLRTFPVWHALPETQLLVAAVGVLTAVIATGSSRVQSNIKGQIGYASIAQVGLMLVELALGLKSLVLFHMVANACLRCYQLLVSPSVVAHLLRVQSASRELRISDWSLERRLPKRWRNRLYVVALHEGYLESAVRAVLWSPLQRVGHAVHRLDRPAVRLVGLLLAGSGIVTLATRGFAETPGAEIFYVLAMLAASLSALAERTSALRAWNAVGASTLLAAGAVLATGTDGLPDALVYLAGTVPAWATGWAAIRRLDRSEGRALTWYHGLTASRPLASTTFFFAALALSGFPISPAFVGEDLLLHHAMGHHHWLAAGLTVSFVANGIALLRLYVRLCLGPRERRFEASASTGRSPGGRIPEEYINNTVISNR